MIGHSLVALLGPTNTGKTHRAVERMLEHDSGMIGLPLRLLAREVYDRVTARIGEAAVALVTGEEKRVPSRPQYWICTVEAMPLDREVDFLAVDEVQLAAHPQRGHVFTDRILRARGRRETWLLGSATMRPMLAELVPTAAPTEHPRLSTLRATESRTLAALPRRTAVVAFSVLEVYELADRLRRRHGGAAVVLGALSPRTRNAQVAMYQAGEVDYLAATDAIGMGLNLDVDHVAFAALSKFDGRQGRELDVAEIAQVAGRAGRYLRDGTFGALAPVELPLPVMRAVELHRFAPLSSVQWRNAELDFASVDALLASLAVPARRAILRRADGADDHRALVRLAGHPDVAKRARGAEAVRLLWDVCQIPDYKKLLFEVHVDELCELYLQLAGSAGVVDGGWLGRRLAALDDPSGDVDALVARIAAIRTLSYVAHHPGWLARADEARERTRALEDRLSDALHDRLVQRFVERRPRAAASRPRTDRAAGAGARVRGRSADARRDRAEPAARPDGPFAALAAFRVGAPAAAPAGGAGDGSSRWIEDLVDAPHERLRVDDGARILDGDRCVARMCRGVDVLHPDVRLSLDGAVGAGAQQRLLRRLVAFSRDLVALLLAPLRAGGSTSPAVRGAIYRLEQGLGTALVDEGLAALADDDRAALEARGVVVGTRVVYLPALLEPQALAVRAALVAAFVGREALRPLPPGGGLSFDAPRDADAQTYARLGFVVVAGRALRADLAERIAARVDAGGAEIAGDVVGDVARLSSSGGRRAAAIVEALRRP